MHPDNSVMQVFFAVNDFKIMVIFFSFLRERFFPHYLVCWIHFKIEEKYFVMKFSEKTECNHNGRKYKIGDNTFDECNTWYVYIYCCLLTFKNFKKTLTRIKSLCYRPVRTPTSLEELAKEPSPVEKILILQPHWEIAQWFYPHLKLNGKICFKTIPTGIFELETINFLSTLG